jgi:phosphate transport system protein
MPVEIRKAFHEELAQVGQDVIRLAALASEAIQAGTSALLEADLAGVERVIANDQRLDDLNHSIEEHCYLLLACQQPMATDLRTLVAVLRMIHEVERIGDLMVKIAKAARRLYPGALDARVRGIFDRMREQATVELRVAVDAFADRDPARASALGDMDDVMDELQKELFRVILGMPPADEGSLQRAVQLALVGRYYERIADHAVNVGQRVRFMVTGQLTSDAPTLLAE